MSDKPVLTINPWLPSLVTPGYSRTIVAGAMNAAGPNQDVYASGVGQDDFFVDPIAKTIRLKPDPMREDFWTNDAYSQDWLTIGQWRMHESGPFNQISSFTQVDKNVIISKSSSVTFNNQAIIPSASRLNSFFTDNRRNPELFAWVAESEAIFPDNCGFAVRLNQMQKATVGLYHPITIAFGQFVLSVRTSVSADLFMWSNEREKFVQVSYFTWGAAGTSRQPGDILLYIIPGGYNCISILAAGATVDGSRNIAMQSGKVLCNLFSYASIGKEPSYDPGDDMNVTTQAGPLVIGTGIGVGLRFSIAPIRYTASADGKSVIIGPYNLLRPISEAPVLKAYQRRNRCPMDCIALEAMSMSSYGNAFIPNVDEKLGIKLTMKPSLAGAYYSPEVFAINYEVNPEWTQDAPAGHPTIDASEKWQLIEFNRSVELMGGKFNVKLIENKRGTFEESFLRVVQAVDLAMPVETAPGVFASQTVCSGIVDVSKPKFTGGVYSNQLRGFDLLEKLHRRPIGNIKALSGLNLKEIILTALEGSSIYRDYIYWNSQLGDIDASYAPNDWYDALENQSWGSLLESCLKQYSGELRIVVKPQVIGGQFYLIQVYQKPNYSGVPELTIYDYDCAAAAPGFWERAKYGVFKTKADGPNPGVEYAVQGAKYHRLYGIGSSSTGGESRKLMAFMNPETDRIWTDPTYYNYEGECKTHYISAPDLWAASKSGVNRAVQSFWEREAHPMRLCEFKSEYHPSIDIDKFFRLYTNIGNGPCNAGVWRIVDIDVEIQGALPETWTALVTGELVEFGEVGL